MKRWIWCCLVLAACGDDDLPASDAALPDDATVECALVDGRGGAGRFATVDEALASGAAGVCLSAGDFAPPSAPLSRDVEIRGMAESRLVASTCLEVSLPAVLERPERGVASAVLHVTGGARVVVREVELRGCDVGAFVDAGELTLESASVGGVDLGVLGVGSESSVVLRDSTLVARRLSATDRVPFAGGAGVLEGASLLASGVRVEGAAGTFGLVGLDGSVAIDDSEIVGGLAGFLVRADDARLTDVRVSGLEAVRLGEDEVIAANLVLGGTALLERLSIDDVDGHGLVAREGASVTLVDVVADRVTSVAFLARPDARVTLDSCTVRRSAVAVSADTRGELTLGGVVRFEDVAFGISVLGGGRVVVPATADLIASGSGAGALVDEGGSAELLAGRFSAFEIGLLNFGATTASNLSFAGHVAGFAAADGRLVGSDLSVDDATTFGFYTSGGDVELDRVTIRRAAFGAYLRGGTHRFADVRLESSATLGLRLDDAATLTMRAGAIVNGGSRGIEVIAGSTLDVRDTELRANVDAALAIYDADAQVGACTFGGTLPDETGRADEVRVVSALGEASVTLESSQFDLDVTRDCSAGRCALLLGEGEDVVGIVRPNCLVENPSTATVRTVVDQAGASFTFEGDATWSTLLAGRATNLGLPSGAASIRPTLPVLPSAPTIPTEGF
ncbi:MAG: hypothetical protein H6722_17530 [Sandaracinus sp.]|nr:hypothetical protein [Sandaracinus sp.]MCB9625146.1 hypothetical protein [Sandaracinus sp.]